MKNLHDLVYPKILVYSLYLVIIFIIYLYIRLKRDLKRTKALLRDAQTMLERSKGDSTGKAALRQLKNQLEDAECVRAAAVKAKQALEQELNESQASLEEALRQRSEAEERANVANRERTELLSQLEENEEELAQVSVLLIYKSPRSYNLPIQIYLHLP